ncbi:hypothetical protein BV154_000665 [Haemophilus influenzae]|uniref:Antitoxin ParD n=1 Tax=Haemophilus influenzae TaxID=727 RepID=A0A2S9RPX4_HAEIF|nr:hypothetical protein [Haemophilus influenzae]PRI85797.1 hypothetical protein BV020_01025 [Haemophilus influenzae]PRI88143.1 hypothetical protein BV021_00550 [Haemophilus influenzae]PRI92900.1 hypothetical protein BV025_01601 [Haemophilus influenzae]PRJ61286.1 hypothetical protein BV102_00804 [Haemophilus influenzae]PRJ84094.1 hypothetical protein BV154_00509 [Haemophilus influenzae]
MFTLSVQQSEQFADLMKAGHFKSEHELFDEMLKSFQYQQKLATLRKEIDKARACEAVEVTDLNAFFDEIKCRGRK